MVGEFGPPEPMSRVLSPTAPWQDLYAYLRIVQSLPKRSETKAPLWSLNERCLSITTFRTLTASTGNASFVKRYHVQECLRNVDVGEGESTQCADAEDIVERENERAKVCSKEVEGRHQKQNLRRSTLRVRIPARCKDFVKRL